MGVKSTRRRAGSGAVQDSSNRTATTLQIVGRFRGGDLVEEIAKRYGVTHQAVDLRLTRALGLKAKREQTSINRQQRAARAAETKRLERLRLARPCVVCGDLILRGAGTGPLLTCSRMCTQIYRDNRHRLNEMVHRRVQALSILRHKDRRRPSQVRWAVAVLNDPFPPAKNRSYIQSDSRASTLLAAVRPDLIPGKGAPVRSPGSPFREEDLHARLLAQRHADAASRARPEQLWQ